MKDIFFSLQMILSHLYFHLIYLGHIKGLI